MKPVITCLFSLENLILETKAASIFKLSADDVFYQ